MRTLRQAFCHCADCRRWGGSIAQAAKLYPADSVKVEGTLLTKDKDGKKEGSNSWRHSCAACGGVVYDNKAHMGMAMVLAGLSDKPFTKSMPLYYAEKIIAIKDCLFKNCAADFGGSGETADE